MPNPDRHVRAIIYLASEQCCSKWIVVGIRESIFNIGKSLGAILKLESKPCNWSVDPTLANQLLLPWPELNLL
jgi:hypothetical protein